MVVIYNCWACGALHFYLLEIELEISKHVSICIPDVDYTTTNHQLTTIPQTSDTPSSADVVCADNTMTVYVPRSIIGDVDDLHFEDSSCAGTIYNSTHVRLSTALDRCGTVMEVCICIDMLYSQSG